MKPTQRLRLLISTAALVVVVVVWLHYGKDGIEALAAAVGSWAGLTHLAHAYIPGK